ncbi:hypothetical protein D3C85_1642180 [compost metagenome]
MALSKLPLLPITAMTMASAPVWSNTGAASVSMPGTGLLTALSIPVAFTAFSRLA